ncbi:DUF6263 family protein [Niabella yanshanensis]|uniref:DUF6263 family protein n=1 Tax=Niabella yanshanensis TaxID=577386 RepID=A0ABZ0W3N5_9BACT|nr:DUF6263 family protein [Niabella yanshanensis]WQD37554.1 DUF6263 family protein [Niabella yanshanensis]
MKKHLLLYLLTCFTLTTIAQAQKAYTLKFNPPDESQYAVALVSQTKMIQNIMDQNMDMNMDYNLNSTYSIATEGSNKKLTLVYDKFDMNMQIMGQQVKMSSEDTDTTNEASAAFRALKGQSMSLLMNEYGKVLRIEGAEEMLNKMGGAGQQQEAIKGVVGEDALKNMIEQSFGFYPKTPVKAGESWSTEMSLKQPYIIAGSATYTLVKVEGKKAFIDFTGKLSTDSSASMTSNGIEVNFAIEGTFSGSSEVDTDTGIPLKSVIQQKMKGNIEAGGQKIPMAVSSDITMTTARKQ